MTEQTQQDGKKSAGRKGFGISFKVSAKGALSVYGLGRFPVTLYREQWLRLLERTDDLKAFMEEHADELTKKGEGAPGESAPGEGDAPAAAPAAAAAAAPVETATTVEEAGAPVTPSDDGDDDGADDPDLPPDDYDAFR